MHKMLLLYWTLQKHVTIDLMYTMLAMVPVAPSMTLLARTQQSSLVPQKNWLMSRITLPSFQP